MAKGTQPFLDLFLQLRSAGLVLTLEQYDLLVQSLEQGMGLGDWPDLKRVCRCLWVKQEPKSRDAQLFEQVFEEYVREKQLVQPLPAVAPERERDDIGPSFENRLPKIPPRQFPDSQAEGERLAPVAIESIKTDWEPLNTKNLRLQPTELPVSTGDVEAGWRVLRRPVAEGLPVELDVEATVAKISQEGLFGEMVLRPAARRRTELVVLLDDAGAMVPFGPALKPLLEAVQENRVSPARLYRFTSYPTEFLYPAGGGRAVPVRQVLSQLNGRRTVVMVLSDAGAATRSYSEERVRETEAFLQALRPCVREVLWLNPLPEERWEQTSAMAIAGQLVGPRLGQMLPFVSESLSQAVLLAGGAG